MFVTLVSEVKEERRGRKKQQKVEKRTKMSPDSDGGLVAVVSAVWSGRS